MLSHKLPSLVLLDEWSMENLSMEILYQTLKALEMYDGVRYLQRSVFNGLLYVFLII